MSEFLTHLTHIRATQPTEPIHFREVNREAEYVYTTSNRLGDLDMFLNSYYIERETDRSLAQLMLSSAVEQSDLDEMGSISQDAYSEANNFESKESLVLSLTGAFAEFVKATLERDYIVNAIAELMKTGKDWVRDQASGRRINSWAPKRLISNFERVRGKLVDFKRCYLLLGRSGSGKTLLAFNLAKKFKWSYVVRASDASDFSESGLFNVLKARLEAVGAGPLDHHLLMLSRFQGAGLLVFDGIDECPGFGENRLVTLLSQLNERPGTYKILLTCRSDYIESNRADSQVRWANWRESISILCHLEYMASMREVHPSDWLSRYCECFAIPKELMSSAWNSLSHRCTPRDLQHIFTALAQFLRFADRLPDPLIYSEMLSIYADYVTRDCRQRLPIREDLGLVFHNISRLAKRYWERRKQLDLGVSLGDLDLPSLGQNVERVFFTLLNSCNELVRIPESSKYEWRIRDYPFFVLSKEIVHNESLASEIEVIDLIGEIKSEYGKYAADVLVYVFYHLHLGAHSIALQEQLGYQQQGSTGQLHLVRKVIEALNSGGWEVVSLLIYLFEHEGVIDVSMTVGEEAFSFLSRQTAADYLYVLSESLLTQPTAAAGRLGRYVATAKHILERVPDVDIPTIEREAGIYAKKLIDDDPSDPVFNLSLLSFLGKLSPALSVINDIIVVWVRRVISDNREINFLDEVLFMLGEQEPNIYTRKLSREAAEVIVSLDGCQEWICSDAKMYRSDHFYARRDVVNAFVDANRLYVNFDSIPDEGRFSGPVNDAISRLMTGNREHRRNAIFMVQRFFPAGIEIERLEELLGSEEDLVLISTILGLICNARFSSRPPRRNAAKKTWSRIVRYANSTDWERQFLDELEQASDADQVFGTLARFRGIVELVDYAELRRIVKEWQGAPVSVEVRAMLAELIKEEKHLLHLEEVLEESLGISVHD